MAWNADRVAAELARLDQELQAVSQRYATKWSAQIRLEVAQQHRMIGDNGLVAEQGISALQSTLDALLVEVKDVKRQDLEQPSEEEASAAYLRYRSRRVQLDFDGFDAANVNTFAACTDNEGWSVALFGPNSTQNFLDTAVDALVDLSKLLGRPQTQIEDLISSMAASIHHLSAIYLSEEAAQLNNRAISLARVHNGRNGADSSYFGTWLARLLIQRSRHEMDLSAYKSALPFINEAVDIARSLFHSSPAEHRVLLGEALGWSSYALHHNDRPAASYAHAVEAAALIRVAFEANPERYRFLFALHLEELVGRSMVARRAARALPFSEEAVLLRRQIYSTSAMGKDRGWLAICLSLHSSVLLGASRAADALGVAEEAVALARETFTEPKRTSMCHYAVAADRLAEVYAALGRQDQALVTANEAVQLWRQMYQARPRGLHLAWLIGALIFVSDAAAKCGTYELARGALEEATALARTDPHGLTATERLRRLSDIHLKSSELLERLGKPEAGLSAAFEAVRLSHQQLSVASDSMDVSFITARLAAQLWQVSNLSSQTEGKDQEALTAALECTSIFREHHISGYGTDTLYNLNDALERTLACYEALGQEEQAAQVRTEMAELRAAEAGVPTPADEGQASMA